jgi:hypothetical protein
MYFDRCLLNLCEKYCSTTDLLPEREQLRYLQVNDHKVLHSSSDCNDTNILDNVNLCRECDNYDNYSTVCDDVYNDCNPDTLSTVCVHESSDVFF